MSKPLDVLIGNDVKFSGVASDEDGAFVDPDVVTFTVHPADATEDDTVYTYLDTADIVRDSAGHYHIWVQRDIEGEYTGFFAGTGSIRMRGCARVRMHADCS